MAATGDGGPARAPLTDAPRLRSSPADRWPEMNRWTRSIRGRADRPRPDRAALRIFDDGAQPWRVGRISSAASEKFQTCWNQSIKPRLYYGMRPLALSGPAAKHSPSPSVFAAVFFFLRFIRFQIVTIRFCLPAFAARRRGSPAVRRRWRKIASAPRDRRCGH